MKTELAKILEAVSNEVKEREVVDEAMDELDIVELLDVAMESSLSEIERGVNLFMAVTDTMERYSSEALTPDRSLNYRTELSGLFLTAGVRLSVDDAVSFEADDEKGEKKPADDKGMLTKLWEWLKKQWETFNKWLSEKVKRVDGIKKKVEAEAIENEKALKAL